jgi:hypothetical protein
MKGPYRSLNKLCPADAAYIAGLIDGEGTVTLSRKHAADNRQLSISISSTEKPMLEYVLEVTGVGKITNKRRSQEHHKASYSYAVYNRHALGLLAQVHPFLRSYKRSRGELILRDYVRLTPRNGKYTPELLAERETFEELVMNTVPSRGNVMPES